MAKQLIVICFLPLLLAGVLGDIVTDGQNTLLTTAVPLKTDVLTQSAAQANVLGVVSNFASNPTALASGAGSYLTNLVTPHLDLFNTLFDQLLSILSPALTCVFELPGKLTQAITTIAGSFVSCVAPIGTAASNLLSQVLNVQIAAQAVNIVGTLTNVLGCVLGSLLNPGGLLGCVLNLVNAVLNTLTGLLSTIVGLLVSVLGTVLSVATCLLSAATSVLGTAAGLVIGLVGCAAGVGTNITVPTLPGFPSDHKKILNDGYGKINATAPTQQQFDSVAAQFNATALNLTKALPNYTEAYIRISVSKSSRTYALYLSTYAKIYQSNGDTVTANCALNGSNAINAYVNNSIATIVNAINNITLRVQTLQNIEISLEQQKYDLVVNKGYAAVSKCDTTFATDAQVQSCVDNAVANFISQLKSLQSQINAILDEIQALQKQPDALISAALLANGQYATAAYQDAKKCSGGKL